ncbi:putative class II aldolase/adducin domain protein [Mycobacterium xenopi 4042]|uniref:Putative class II aldolase/adducin domain protein n=1 Tax=Mycobacterium xenopi 4042 TaxID=1299334 RepID=X8AL76_MYCXE|nr:putative class II aldolase/adducin domain protein [Mycobacterium xenopi 4042]
MATTFTDSKAELMRRAQERLAANVGESGLTARQKLALTCRALFDAGHDSGWPGRSPHGPSSPARTTPSGWGWGSTRSPTPICCLSTRTSTCSTAREWPTPPTAFTAGSTARGPTSSASCTPTRSTARRCRCSRFR